ncbi:hypothetical protein J4Q44_G00373470 [Coregonus suidteri]|uniref:Ubiquitin carboxyl-terminal hydrolase MINDY n=1 Tax=Coregonus suidteri TaxID=861788 RepID=A0AAN8QKB5_9TELE
MPGVKMTPAPPLGPSPALTCCLFLGRAGGHHRIHLCIRLSPVFQNCCAACTGPCHVTLAFLLKNILFNRESSNWRHITEEEQKAALCSTLAEILEQACSTSSTTSYCLVTWAKGQSPHTNTHTPLTGGPETSQNLQDQQPTALSAEDLGFERFHSILQKRIVKSLSELREEVVSLYETWKGLCGVLLFLYSVILTKGIVTATCMR